MSRAPTTETNRPRDELPPSTFRVVKLAAMTAGAFFFGLTLAAFANTGFYTRYWADDYCIAGHLRDRGLWDAQVFWYEIWTGRFAYVFVTDLVAFLGIEALPLFAATLILLWLVALSWALLQVSNLAFGQRSLVACVLLAEVIIFTYIEVAPNRTQSVYWLSGGSNYTAPLLFGTVLIGLIARRTAANVAPGWGHLALIFAVAFIAGGFAETYMAWQISALFLALVGCLLLPATDLRSRLRLVLLVALAGAVIAGAVVAASPGNDVREGSLPPPMALPEVATNSLTAARSFMVTYLPKPQVLLAGIAAALLTVMLARPSGPLQSRTVTLQVLGAILVTYLLVASTYAPSYYVLTHAPPARALVVAEISVIACVAFLGYVIGNIVRSQLLPALPHVREPAVGVSVAVALMLLAAPSLSSAQTQLEQREELSGYAAAWDARHEDLREAGRNEAGTVGVPVVRHAGGLLEVSRNAENWVNECMANYYDVESVVQR